MTIPRPLLAILRKLHGVDYGFIRSSRHYYPVPATFQLVLEDDGRRVSSLEAAHVKRLVEEGLIAPAETSDNTVFRITPAGVAIVSGLPKPPAPVDTPPSLI